MAPRMARIANVSLDELGKAIFSASASEDRPVEDLLFTDFKEFHIAGHFFGVSRLLAWILPTCSPERTSFWPSCVNHGGKRLQHDHPDADRRPAGGTQLIYLGDEDTIRHAFNVDVRDNEVFLPKVMSRKKQIIPMLTALWG